MSSNQQQQSRNVNDEDDTLINRIKNLIVQTTTDNILTNDFYNGGSPFPNPPKIEIEPSRNDIITGIRSYSTTMCEIHIF
ncbi:11534_t:CDS:2 [Funneliformis mosseae]|uniref:11534_t:CDS:1 n=1 Tax=Funneliformis mosseae TaxID=27381 RepID=A0A9N9GHZ0_FUNMO|nr:11534_t:CDS:2 [Funneliformis mosseae]